MKAVEHCQREIQLSAMRGDASPSKPVFPLCQFNQKKSLTEFKKAQSTNTTLTLDKTKYSEVEAHSDNHFFPSIETRDIY